MEKPKYGRTPIESSMPSLTEACADFRGFARGEKRAARIFEFLLVVIQRYRAAKPKRFYAVRDIAKFFGVSTCTVAVVYRRLTHEGLLTRIRSSQTMIPARTQRPKFALRGVVCAPIWLPGFLQFLDWRRRFSELEEELSRHRLVLEPIFYRHGEEVHPTFVDRVLKFNPDYVLWDSPAHTDRMTMESIIDAGVPILTILGARSQALPGRIYRRSQERGLQRGLEEWKASGEVDRLVVPQAGKEHYQENIIPVLQRCSLPYELKVYFPPDPPPQYFKHLARSRRTGIIFSDGLFFARLCAKAPEKMFQLFRRHRVMVWHQVVMHSFTMPPDLTVDALLFPNKRLARRIAADLSQSKGALPSNEEVFEAEWRPRTPLKDIVQIDYDE